MKINVQFSKPKKKINDKYTEIKRCSDDAFEALCENPIESYKRIRDYYHETVRLSKDPFRQQLIANGQKTHPTIEFPNDELTDILEKYIFKPSVMTLMHNKVVGFNRLSSLWPIPKRKNKNSKTTQFVIQILKDII